MDDAGLGSSKAPGDHRVVDDPASWPACGLGGRCHHRLRGLGPARLRQDRRLHVEDPSGDEDPVGRLERPEHHVQR
eukprot:8833902-Pyramimonas_sp.AAC.1